MHTPPSTMLAPLAPGTLLRERYRLVGLAGQGRFGQIYLARDQKRDDQLCVLQEFIPQETDRAVLQTRWRQFHEAAACLYKLKHLQLPQFQVMIAQEQRFYWVQQYVAGSSYQILLEERQAAGQAFPEAEVRRLFEQILPVLHYLHDRGVAHGNLSPDTLIWQPDSQLSLLVDFGLVYELVIRLQLHPVAVNTPIAAPGYTPPEALPGQIAPSHDLYALAVTAVVLLTGNQPAELYDPATQKWHWETIAIRQPPFRQLLQQMLHPQPHKRVASAKQVSRLLQKQQPVKRRASQPRGAIAPATVSSARPRLSSIGLGVLVAFLVGFALSIAGHAWKFLASVQSEPKLSASPALPVAPESETGVQSSPSAIVPVPTLPPTAAPTATPAPATLPADLQAQQQQLEVDPQFWGSLLAEVLPSPTSPDAEQSPADQAAIAKHLLEQLQALSPETRRKLGTYRRANYDEWLAQLGETGTTSLTLDTLADQRLAEMFPELQGKALNPRTFGQVWYAIAEEQLSTAKAQKPAGTAR